MAFEYFDISADITIVYIQFQPTNDKSEKVKKHTPSHIYSYI